MDKKILYNKMILDGLTLEEVYGLVKDHAASANANIGKNSWRRLDFGIKDEYFYLVDEYFDHGFPSRTPGSRILLTKDRHAKIDGVNVVVDHLHQGASAQIVFLKADQSKINVMDLLT